MKQILKTTLLEYSKSAFLIDLVKHESDKIYVSILQTTQVAGSTPIRQEVKINPTVLVDIIDVLNSYRLAIPQKTTPSRFSEHEKLQIQKRYLNGISISDLTTQFDCTREIIEQILRNKGIEILSDEEMKPPKKKWQRRYKK